MSNSAWLVYNPITLEIKEIVWTKPELDCIAIDRIVALEFMTGKLNFSSFMIARHDGEIKLEKYHEPEIKNTFSNLSKLDNCNLSVQFLDQKIEIISKIAHKFILYCTAKENPSWLVNSWKLNTLPFIDDKIVIEKENVKDFSWFIGDLR
jgi:hypothetical protein